MAEPAGRCGVMRILITGICGFTGKALAESLLARMEGVAITGIDNLLRPGSEMNRGQLRRMGIGLVHGDVRCASDWSELGEADWVIDAAANPSVLAGLGGSGSSRRLFEHNLASLVNVLEYCREKKAGLLLLSTSRVYSIPALLRIALRQERGRFELDETQPMQTGLSPAGIGVDFSTAAPISLYGATKLASEAMALEYGSAFGFPVWITRCGVLAGAGQFGTPDQGIFAYWLNAHLRRRPLRYIGFEGNGFQTRDAFHPRDLCELLMAQMNTCRPGGPRVYTAGGGVRNSMSLAQLTEWCDGRFGPHPVDNDLQPRPYDIPWIAMDNGRAEADFGWSVNMPIGEILEEIAAHAGKHPEWLEVSGL